MSITDDKMFASQVEITWSVKEDEDASVFKKELLALIDAIRMKLRVITN